MLKSQRRKKKHEKCVLVCVSLATLSSHARSTDGKEDSGHRVGIKTAKTLIHQHTKGTIKKAIKPRKKLFKLNMFT